MKTIVFYGRRQVGMVVLTYLVAKGYKVKVIPEDDLIKQVSSYFKLEIVDLDHMGEFDLFICCHGEKIIPEQYLQEGKFINIHPCLFKYKGSNPIKRYIENKDIEGSVGCHYMVKEVDAGEVIAEVYFDTPVITDYGQFFNLAIPHYYECIERALKKIYIKPSVAIVRIHKSKVLLRLWLSYYSKHFDKLYVVACQTPEGEFGELQQEFSFELVPTDQEIYSQGAHSVVWELQRSLYSNHEWVFYSDADEIVVPDLDKYDDLKDFMLRTPLDQPFCKGYEVVQAPDEAPIDYTKPYLAQRSLWRWDDTVSYNKPLLTRIPTEYNEGFHHPRGMNKSQILEQPASGLYLVHLKYADPTMTFDFPLGSTGTRDNVTASSSDVVAIPEKIRGAF